MPTKISASALLLLFALSCSLVHGQDIAPAETDSACPCDAAKTGGTPLGGRLLRLPLGLDPLLAVNMLYVPATPEIEPIEAGQDTKNESSGSTPAARENDWRFWKSRSRDRTQGDDWFMDLPFNGISMEATIPIALDLPWIEKLIGGGNKDGCWVMSWERLDSDGDGVFDSVRVWYTWVTPCPIVKKDKG